MRVRPAALADVPTIVAMLADDQLGGQREVVTEPLDAAYVEAFAAIDADANNLLVVAEDAGAVVGTLQLTFIPYLTYRGSWRAQIEGVRIARGRRGEGLGAMLIRWAIEEAEHRGCRLVQLTSNTARTDARRFYERLGFVASHVGMKLRLAAPDEV